MLKIRALDFVYKESSSMLLLWGEWKLKAFFFSQIIQIRFIGPLFQQKFL